MRERVRRAIAGPVAEADKLIAELQDTDADTRVSILVSGWFRGLAAALEELSIAVDDLFAQRAAGNPGRRAATRGEREDAFAVQATAERSERIDLTEADDKQLSETARQSREETARHMTQTRHATSFTEVFVARGQMRRLFGHKSLNALQTDSIRGAGASAA